MNGSGIWTEPEEPEKCVTRYVVKRTHLWKTEIHFTKNYSLAQQIFIVERHFGTRNIAMNTNNRVPVFTGLTLIQEKCTGARSLSQNNPSYNYMHAFHAHMWGKEIPFIEQPPCARKVLVFTLCNEKI